MESVTLVPDGFGRSVTPSRAATTAPAGLPDKKILIPQGDKPAESGLNRLLVRGKSCDDWVVIGRVVGKKKG